MSKYFSILALLIFAPMILPQSAIANGPALQYLHHREYDPGLGVFVSPDPALQENLPGQPYAYATDSPATYTDPSGQWSWRSLLKLEKLGSAANKFWRALSGAAKREERAALRQHMDTIASESNERLAGLYRAEGTSDRAKAMIHEIYAQKDAIAKLEADGHTMIASVSKARLAVMHEMLEQELKNPGGLPGATAGIVALPPLSGSVRGPGGSDPAGAQDDTSWDWGAAGKVAWNEGLPAVKDTAISLALPVTPEDLADTYYVIHDVFIPPPAGGSKADCPNGSCRPPPGPVYVGSYPPVVSPAPSRTSSPPVIAPDGEVVCQPGSPC